MFREVNFSHDDQNVWRWMLGVEFFPAILYFGLLFFVPKSPRWLYTQKIVIQAKAYP